MSSSSKSDSRQETLGESWIEFDRTNAAPLVELSYGSVATSSPNKIAPVNGKALEKLLLEAQRESSYASSHVDSLASSQASPHSQLSPTNGQLTDHVSLLQLDDTRLSQEIEGGEEYKKIGATWVWDWSSRPEAVPPSFCSVHFKHPVTTRHSLSIRNTRIMRGIVFSLENLPLLVFTHACTFVLGAASMMVYLKRYCRWSAAGSATLNS